MYHGAEHKVIHAYEACGRPDAERARAFLHPAPALRHRLPAPGDGHRGVRVRHRGQARLPWLVLSRLVGIPLIIGISYEIGIKWLGKHPDGWLARILLWPGLQLQRLTTREPTPDQLEVAAAALEEVMRMDEAARVALKELAAQA